MHLAFLAPEYPSDQRLFVYALKRLGARVSGIGGVAWHYLPRDLRTLLDDYERVDSVESEGDVLGAARTLNQRYPLDRIEAVHEKQVLPAALARAALDLVGTPAASIQLCRDKFAMKRRMHEAGLRCAPCLAASTEEEIRNAVDELGYPVILKPRQGYGGLETFVVEDQATLEAALSASRSSEHSSWVVEKRVDGDELFVDTLTLDGSVTHEFLASYRPNVLEALSDPGRAACVISDNRLEQGEHEEIRTLARRVVEVLDLGTLATHMEVFRTSEGLVFSEIGTRPPGERLWELHALGNDLDLHLEWASMVSHGRPVGSATRRFSTASVQIRPSRQGRIAGYRGLASMLRELAPWILSSQVLTVGYPTTPLEAGYLGNVWFRLLHPEIGELESMVDRIEDQVEILVQ